ncbi:CU044_2847 family protein [Actinomadura sp. WMMA1423]|uniref:CU044_2847 family protein n=1 Tax=Actinomadura sp. WMMA1423 TaxID=2591108 RepID=UPI001146BAE7|nr:CU044_2847 family protein [Actinomadura sp. WMMA1423]
MPHFLEIPLRDGERMLIEMTDEEAGLSPVGRGRDVIETLPESFTAALGRVRLFTEEIFEQTRRYRRQPDRVAVEFGLKFSAKSGIVIAEAAGEAYLKFIPEWTRGVSAAQPPESDDDDGLSGGDDLDQ